MKLVLPKAIEKKIHDYVMSVDSEIAGMGKVRVEGDNIIVEEVMIYQQEVTMGTADLSPQAMAKWQSDLVRAGGSPKQWKLWWHSHNTMAAFFSARDTATIDLQTEGDWMVSLVVNKRKDRECRLDTYRPFRMHLDKLSIEIEGGVPEYEVPADIVAEVLEKVKSPVVTYAKPATYSKPFGFSEKGLFKKNDSTIEALIGAHRKCPKGKGLGNVCDLPYGDIKGAAYADCTSKAFKKTYGKKPFASHAEVIEPTTDKDIAETMSIIKILEDQITEHDKRGTGGTEDCITLMTELADWYYQLADMTADEDVAQNIRAEAQLLENDVSYGVNRLLAIEAYQK